MNLDQQTAVIVVEVQPGSPAERAGLLVGDIIVALGGIRITDPTDLRTVLRPDRVGESIEQQRGRRLQVPQWIFAARGMSGTLTGQADESCITSRP